ncbi:MAG: squalene/phytoene synthase family protein [Chlamydiae bacterium]|nr:squalene/phytoene synthase family protein [Chlamydiota bacterium]
MNLASSYRLCSKIARSQAKNFYYGFLFLPREKRWALSAVYAFMRICDDIADGSFPLEEKKEKLSQWKGCIQNLSSTSHFSHPILPALQDTLGKFQIPLQYFSELIEGVEMDLTPKKFHHFEDLYSYCYKVASVVGLVCLYVFGFKDERALKQGEFCGVAFQLTNILRDLKEDVERGRIYLPEEDLEKFQYPRDDLMSLRFNSHFIQLMRFECERAESYYQKAEGMIQHVSPDSRKAIKVMMEIYHGILRKIERRHYNTLSQRIKLNFFEKGKILLTCK